MTSNECGTVTKERFGQNLGCYSWYIGKLQYLDVDPVVNANRYFEVRTDQFGRYASWDHCFNYFRKAYEENRLDSLTRGDELQNSCLHLGFYLASWGMYRGKSSLLQRSAHALAPVVQVISLAPRGVWELDVENYDNDSIKLLLDWTEKVRSALPPKSTDTLVTKVSLGVFGNVPAYDRFFRAGFNSFGLNEKSLEKVKTYFDQHQDKIKDLQYATIDFAGKVTKHRYTQAKVIDMIFFTAGGGMGSNSGND